MMLLKPISPSELIHELIPPNNLFPNNTRYPFLLYKQAFNFDHDHSHAVSQFLQHNSWVKPWIDSIYSFDHYHSNNHEVLVITQGKCKVQVGGPHYKTYDIQKGDVIIFPAGVAHKNLGSSEDFKCVGAYAFDIDYDMNYGRASEHPQVEENIKQVGQPKCDPVFGEKGLLFDYWK
jgi:uncharacterized protein YjlB